MGGKVINIFTREELRPDQAPKAPKSEAVPKNKSAAETLQTQIEKYRARIAVLDKQIRLLEDQITDDDTQQIGRVQKILR